MQHEHEQKGVSSNKAEPTFSSIGFKNWKKVPMAFKGHEYSEGHEAAIYQAKYLEKAEDILLKLAGVGQEERKNNTGHIRTIFLTLRYLLRQGIAIRGHEHSSSNFNQLMRLQSQTADDPTLYSWLQRKTSWCSHEMQNKMLEYMALSVSRGLAKTIASSDFFGLISDETSDISGIKQMSIGFRIVTNELKVRIADFGAAALRLCKIIC